MIIHRGIMSGIPLHSSFGLDPLSFFIGLLFIVFIFVIPRFSHGYHIHPLTLPLGTPATLSELFPSRRTTRETRNFFTYNEVSHGLQLDILTQNVFEAIQNHASNNFEKKID